MFRLRGVKLCFKLIASFAVLLVLISVMGAIAITAIRGLGHSLDLAVNSTAKKMDVTAFMHDAVAEMRVHASLAEISVLNNKIAEGSMGEVSGTGCASCHTTDRVSANRLAFENAAADILRRAAELDGIPLNPVESKSLEELCAGVAGWVPLYQRYLDLTLKQDFPTAHQIMVEQIYPLVARVNQAADTLNAEQQKALVGERTDASQQASDSLWRTAGTVVFAFVAGLAGLWIVRQVAKTLRLHARELMDMSMQVSGTAGQISQSNEALARGAAQQAQSIHQTSAATEEIQAKTRLNVTGTEEAAQIMAGETRYAAEAGEKLEELLASMNQMVAANSRISSIIQTIDGIAFQTNILALNAAVEAARAGESGLGFSVVADEVRALARRSAEAAKDTADLVSSSIEYNASGTAKLNEVSQRIIDMTKRMAAARQTIDEVNQNGQQQAQNLDQIAQAISQMEQVTSVTAAQAEERAAASRELSAQADQLRDVVTALRELV